MKDGLVSFGLLVSFLYILGIGASIGMKQISEPKNIIRFYSIDNELVSGFCVAGLFAAGMSSLASVIIIIGTAFVKDIWHVVRPMKEKRIIGCTKVFMTLFPIAGIVELTAFAGAVFAASFFPSIFGGLYLRWGTDLGALSSMIAGIAMYIIWRFGFRFKYERLEDIHEIIPAFLISLFTYLLVSALSRNRIPDGDHLDLVFK
jgi:Na+/pantothenate symporter